MNVGASPAYQGGRASVPPSRCTTLPLMNPASSESRNATARATSAGSPRRWTEDDLSELSWHDNHVHGLRVVEGEHGLGELLIDIDFIVEWVRTESGAVGFRIAAADLLFREVSALKISIDYDSITAAMGPFSIDGIERTVVDHGRYATQRWRMGINFPSGQIEFNAAGFVQQLRMEPLLVDRQVLFASERYP